MRALRQYIRSVITEAMSQPKLRIFDFDDTLVKTKSSIYVAHGDGTESKLTPGEFAIYEPLPDDRFDFREFSLLIDPEEIRWTVQILRNLAASGSEVVILTARAVPGPAQQFLRDACLPPWQVVALGDANPLKKAEYIAGRLSTGANYVEFFDDSRKNIAAVEALKGQFPGATIITRLVRHA